VLTGHVITRASSSSTTALAEDSRVRRGVVAGGDRGAASWKRPQILRQEAILADTFKQGGMIVIEPDVESFPSRCLAKLPPMFRPKWGKGLWERLQAL